MNGNFSPAAVMALPHSPPPQQQQQQQPTPPIVEEQHRDRPGIDLPALESLCARIRAERERLLARLEPNHSEADAERQTPAFYQDFSRVSELASGVAGVMRQDRAFIEGYISYVTSIRASLQALLRTVADEARLASFASTLKPTGGDAQLLLHTGAESEAQAKTAISEVVRLQALVAKISAELAQTVAEAASLEKQAAIAAEAAAVAEDEAVSARAAVAEAAAAVARAKALEEEETLRKQQQQREAAERAKRAQQEAEEAERRRRQQQQQQAALGGDGKVQSIDKWPRYTYSCEANDFDGGVVCVLRTCPGTMARDDVIVEALQPMQCASLRLVENEELVSNVVRIRASPKTKGDTTKNLEPALICIPHCAPRHVSSREPVIKALVGTEWIDLETKDSATHDDSKDVRMVEARCPIQLCCTYVVVHRLKKELFTLTRKGGKLTSSVDNRITLTTRPATVRLSTPVTLQIQSVDQASVIEMKQRYPEACDCLVSVSSVLTFGSPAAHATSTAIRALAKPATLTIPIPAVSKAKRPPSASAAGGAEPEKKTSPAAAGRPHTASSGFFGAAKTVAAEPEEKLHLLVVPADERCSANRWASLEDIELTQNKKGDMVTLEMKELPRRVWLLRTRADASASQAERAAAIAWLFLGKRLVRFVVRQKADDPTDIAVACAQASAGGGGGRLERLLRRLEEDGYTEGPQQPSADVVLAEGQSVDVRFRGNVQCDEADVRLQFAFNTQMPARLATYVCEADRFAQKGFDSYRGFVQFIATVPDDDCLQRRFGFALSANPEGAADNSAAAATDKHKEKSSPAAAAASSIQQQQQQPTLQEQHPASPQQQLQRVANVAGGSEQLLAEMLICLPKQSDGPDTPKSQLLRAPVKFSTDGPIDEAFLRVLAADLGDEWKALAQELGIKHMRVQAIVRNNVKTDSEQIIYDVLVTWAKRVPRSVNKAEALCSALLAVGRGDLAEDVRDREADHRLQRADVTRDSQLRRAFARVLRSDEALCKWRQLAAQLGLSDKDLADVDAKMAAAAADGSGGTLHERMLLCLASWKEASEHYATVVALARALKACGVNDAAVDVFRLRRRLH